MSDAKILFVLTGSVACYQACDVLTRLVRNGHPVRVAATPAALRFVGAATLETLSGWPVLELTWGVQEGTDHATLATWADCLIICPGTASTMTRLSAGVTEDFLSELFLAHYRHKARIIVSAMTSEMAQHSSSLLAIARLADSGVHIFSPTALSPEPSNHAGDEMMPAEEAVLKIEVALARPKRRLRILVTSGETFAVTGGWKLSPHPSAGQAGAEFVREFIQRGHEVKLLGSRQPVGVGDEADEYFDTAKELFTLLTAAVETHSFDLVLHAATVENFEVTLLDAAKSDALSKKSQRSEPANQRTAPFDFDGIRERSKNPAVLIAVFQPQRGEFPIDRDGQLSDRRPGVSVDYVMHSASPFAVDPAGEIYLSKTGQGLVASAANLPATARMLEKELFDQLASD
ncbi:flavoprotein [Oleiharenicola lentus]|uniref:flavoprotein n=1 Tax=Oleiharenicola lentus TaxID=2508720 RepID=UPI003F66AF2A